MAHPFVNQALIAMFGLARAPFDISTITGMGLVEGLSLTPVTFIMLCVALRSMDPALEEAAAVSGAKPWQAHRDHAYQRAVLSGMSHAAVTAHVAALNVALLALAVVSIAAPCSALAAAVVVTMVLFYWLGSRAAPVGARR